MIGNTDQVSVGLGPTLTWRAFGAGRRPRGAAAGRRVGDWGHGVHHPWQHRPAGLADRPRLHDVRRTGPRQPPLVARRGGQPSVHQGGPGRRDQLLRHRQRLQRRVERGDRRPRPERADEPRRGRPRDQGARANAPGPQRRRPLAQGDHGRDRPQPAAARHRLRRPLPDPSLGPARSRSRRPSRRCTTSSRPARRATSAPRRCTPGSSPRRSTSPT